MPEVREGQRSRATLNDSRALFDYGARARASARARAIGLPRAIAMTSASKEHLNPERRIQPCVVLELALAFCDERAVEALQLT